MEAVDDGDVFPPKPTRPAEEDCCGSGCSQCVFDVYEANLVRWEQDCREIRDGSRKRGDRDERVYFLSELRYKPFLLKGVADHTHDTKIFTFQAAASKEVVATEELVVSEELVASEELVVTEELVMTEELVASEELVATEELVTTEELVATEELVTTEELVATEEELGLRAGQHVIMKGKASDGSGVSRAYTPIDVRRGEFDVLARLYPDGEMSRHLASLRAGDAAHFRGPYGSLEYRAGAYKRVLMLCAGTGIAPMVAVADAIVRDERDHTVVRLLSCVRTCDDILLRDRLRALSENWNFTARFHVSSGPGSGGVRYGEKVVFARLDRDALRTELGGESGGTLVLVCGTQNFNNDMTEYALALGVQQSNIYIF